jgi:hypothetical protein
VTPGSAEEAEEHEEVIDMAELGDRLAARRAELGVPDPPHVTLDALAADIERRRVESGVTDLPRNSGERRTESKRALLAAIAAVGGKW